MRVFTEIQKIPRWLFIIIIPSFLVTLFLIIHAYVNAVSITKKNELLFVLLAIIAVETIAVFFISSIKQVVRVDASGISYRYTPFKIKETYIPTKKIKHYDLVTYPHAYYGYHVGFWNVLKREPSVTMVGISKAIRITFQDNTTLLLGTKKPDDFLRTLDNNIQKLQYDEVY